MWNFQLLPATSVTHTVHCFQEQRVVSYWCLQGSLPTQWMDLTSGGPTMQLTRFACAYCGLSGTLPNWGGPSGTCYTSSGLQYFDISHNSLVNTIPDGFDSFGNLRALNISGNQFNGYFLKSISNRCTGGFPQLQELRMDHNAFSDTESGE